MRFIPTHIQWRRSDGCWYIGGIGYAGYCGSKLVQVFSTYIVAAVVADDRSREDTTSIEVRVRAFMVCCVEPIVAGRSTCWELQGRGDSLFVLGCSGLLVAYATPPQHTSKDISHREDYRVKACKVAIPAHFEWKSFWVRRVVLAFFLVEGKQKTIQCCSCLFRSRVLG